MKIHAPALLLTLASPALSTDVWVDPVLGDDSNAGTQLEPLRSITAAVALGDVTAHLAPGVYSTATGEVFPLRLEGDHSILATGDASNTRILLPDPTAGTTDSVRVIGDVRIQGVTFEQAGTTDIALSVEDAPWPHFGRLTLLDSRVLGGRTAVDQYRAWSTLERCEFVGQDGTAVSVGTAGVTARDVVVRGAHRGFFGYGLGPTIRLERVQVLDVGGTAVELRNDDNHGNLGRGFLEACLLAGHGTGLISEAFVLWNEVEVVGCTIVSDRGRGVVRQDSLGWIVLRDSIVAGHTGGDLVGLSGGDHCLIGDGNGVSASNGSVAGDPMFVDPASGDYRLGWGSPCIDSGGGFAARDLADHHRSVDGDLQLEPAPDMGALEHRTLKGPPAVRLGQAIALELTGPQGGFSTVVISPDGYAAVGATTPYGRLFLDTTNAVRLVPVPTHGIAPTVLQAPAITDPALVGSQIGIQALTRSLAAPAGGALSQPILVRIDP